MLIEKLDKVNAVKGRETIPINGFKLPLQNDLSIETTSSIPVIPILADSSSHSFRQFPMA